MTSDVWGSGYTHGDSSGGGGVGLFNFFLLERGLIREKKGLIWEGGLIEDLQLGFDWESLVVACGGAMVLLLVHNKHNRADV